DHNYEQLELLSFKDMCREQKLLALLRELQTDLMNDDNIPLENLSQDKPSDLFRKVC
ncbi:13737_t:CDS:1, partial [Funneliformis caledonium]